MSPECRDIVIILCSRMGAEGPPSVRRSERERPTDCQVLLIPDSLIRFSGDGIEAGVPKAGLDVFRLSHDGQDRELVIAERLEWRGVTQRHHRHATHIISAPDDICSPDVIAEGEDLASGIAEYVVTGLEPATARI